ncbi:MAG: hypothetical protein A2018_07590 [Alphaproteobacteria bacterium GWF2_58_20]|nr:MAG: hypothetical protein A2018_07590 [Alphaproteobacteria bacterium GWF2_58_20]
MRKTVLMACLGITFLASPAFAGSVENLERERAELVATMLDPGLSAAERQETLAAGARRLVDFERMVLRDRTLPGRETPAVKMAFANDDLTFLVLASGEKGLWIVDHWLDHMGLSSASLETARRGRR